MMMQRKEREGKTEMMNRNNSKCCFRDRKDV
jgi:hypothetical protein